MIEENYGLIVSRAESFHKTSGISIEEFVSAGHEALVRSVKNFNPEKSKFSTYATTCINHEMGRVLKSEGKQKDIKEQKFQEMAESPNFYELQEDIDEYLPQNLTTIEKGIFYYLKNSYSQKDIIDILDITNSIYHKNLRSLKNKIRTANPHA